jgi:NAD(P)-dependent dehydrogenase (short-subunit alcohol dehydrogenase family)
MRRFFSLRVFTLSTLVLTSAVLVTYRTRVLNDQAMAPLPIAPALANFSNTAVFLGGTSGIALALAQLVSRSSQGSATIVLVGRNQSAAEAAIERMRKEAPPSAKHEYAFEQCNLADGFAGVHALSDRLKAHAGEGGVGMLVMSPGYLTTAGRTENVDGVDKKMAVHLYSRWLVAKELVPLLEKAAENDPEHGARVYTILDSVRPEADALDLKDLGLKTSYSLSRVAAHACAMNNVMAEVRLLLLNIFSPRSF